MNRLIVNEEIKPALAFSSAKYKDDVLILPPARIIDINRVYYSFSILNNIIFEYDNIVKEFSFTTYNYQENRYCKNLKIIAK